MTPPRTLPSAAWRPLSILDRALNRLYGWRFNPLYQSGALAVVLLVVVALTGLYLLVFYRIGAPFESVERITAQAWTGRWIVLNHTSRTAKSSWQCWNPC